MPKLQPRRYEFIEALTIPLLGGLRAMRIGNPTGTGKSALFVFAGLEFKIFQVKAEGEDKPLPYEVLAQRERSVEAEASTGGSKDLSLRGHHRT